MNIKTIISNIADTINTDVPVQCEGMPYARMFTFERVAERLGRSNPLVLNEDPDLKDDPKLKFVPPELLDVYKKGSIESYPTLEEHAFNITKRFLPSIKEHNINLTELSQNMEELA
jgi:hypothetical protein